MEKEIIAKDKVKKLGLVRTIYLFLSISLILMAVIPAVSAGFASSYVPTVDGKPVIVGEAGQTYSYYVYLQNLDNDEINNAITVSNGKNLMTNTLSEYYTVPGNTESDSYPVEIKLKLPSVESGTVYQVTYSVKSSSEDASGVVTFSPVGFDKTIYISVGNPDWDKLIEDAQPIVEETPVPTPSGSSGGGGGGGGSSSSGGAITINDTDDTTETTPVKTPKPKVDYLSNGLDVVNPADQPNVGAMLFIGVLMGLLIIGLLSLGYYKFKKPKNLTYEMGKSLDSPALGKETKI